MKLALFFLNSLQYVLVCAACPRACVVWSLFCHVLMAWFHTEINKKSLKLAD